MLKAVFLDMDNTLLETEEIYEQQKALLFDFLGAFGIARAEAGAVFDDIDRELYKSYGYSRLRQPLIFENTLKHFIPEAEEDMVRTVRDWAETIFQREARLKEGVAEAVAVLAAAYPVYIVTAGDAQVQESRVQKLPFLDKMNGIHIVDKKDKSVYESILRTLDLDADSVVMIGDSLKSDILPAAEAGMFAVWIEAHNFQMEKVALERLPERAFKSGSLLATARHLAEQGTPMGIALLPQPPTAKPASPKPPSP
jgi:putative hydrolase of the HAD superfamily